jgi:hypothetical protein
MLTSIEQVIEQKKNKYCRQAEIGIKSGSAVPAGGYISRFVVLVKSAQAKPPDRFVRRVSADSLLAGAIGIVFSASSILWIEPDSCPRGEPVLYDGAKSKS